MIKLLCCIIFFLVITYLINILISKLIIQLNKFAKSRGTQIRKINIGSEIVAIIQDRKNKMFNLLKICFAGLGFSLILILTKSSVISFAGTVIGFFMPDFINKYITKKLLYKFNNQLIDVATIISNSLRAGTSFAQSLDVVIRETKPPISDEFKKTIQEIKLGIPATEALNNLANRVKSKDLDMFVTTINIARETGGSLPELLNIIADTMRERNKLEGKINALTAQGKMSGYVLGSMPFLLIFILYLISPELIEPMFSTTIGQFMLATVVILVIAGGLLIRKIVRIDI